MSIGFSLTFLFYGAVGAAASPLLEISDSVTWSCAHTERHCTIMPAAWWEMMRLAALRCLGLGCTLCSQIAGLMGLRTGWWGRRSASFSSTLCRRKIRMQASSSEPGSCLLLSQQPLGRWQGDGWYLQPGRTTPPTHTNTHTRHRRNKSTPTHSFLFSSDS